MNTSRCLGLTVIMLVFSIQIVAQINTIKVADRSLEIVYAPYDSTRNFLGDDVGQYVGQTLYLKGMPLSDFEIGIGKKFYGYDNFLTDYSKDDPPYSVKSTYKPAKMGEYSDYYELCGRSFNVLSVIRSPKSAKSSRFDNYYYLELEDTESKERCYFRYDSESEFKFPFIVVGYYNKLRESLIGKQFVFRNAHFSGDHDVITGKAIESAAGRIWSCTDIAIEEQFYYLEMVIQSNLGETLTTDYKVLNKDIYSRDGFTVEEAGRFQSQFGEANWALILDRQVAIGMTEEMVKMSLGIPTNIKSAASGCWWYYDGLSVYFENGLLARTWTDE